MPIKKTFDIARDSTPIAEFAAFLKPAQAMRANAHGATRAFRYRDIRGNIKQLPKYILDALTTAGMVPVYIGGGTVGTNCVIGIKPKSTPNIGHDNAG